MTTPKKKPSSKKTAVKELTFAQLRKEFMKALETCDDEDMLHAMGGDYDGLYGADLHHFADKGAKPFNKEIVVRDALLASNIIALFKKHKYNHDAVHDFLQEIECLEDLQRLAENK